MSTKSTSDAAPVHPYSSTVPLIEIQMTLTNLPVAEHALREEPYERLPYLAGLLQVARSQIELLMNEEMLRQRFNEDF